MIGFVFEANTASTLTKVANEAVQNIIKIINNCTKKDTTVTIENVNIYQYAYDYKAAMSVEGAGDTTLKLVGDNTLRGGFSRAGLEKDDVLLYDKTQDIRGCDALGIER